MESTPGDNGRAAAAAGGWAGVDLRGTRERLLAGLEADREWLLDELVAVAVAGRLPDDVGDVELLRPSMGEVFDLFNACAAQDRELTGEEVAFFERLGAVRCEQGVALEPVIDEFRVAFDQCYAHLAGLAERLPDEDRVGVLRGLTPALYRLRDVAIEAIGCGHERQARRLVASSTGGQAGLLRALLAGNRRRLATEAAYHGLAADQPAVLLVAVGEPATSPGRLRGLLEPLETAVPGATAAVVAPAPTPHVAVLAPISDAPANLLAAARNIPPDRLGVYALPAAPLDGLAEAYRQLAAHLELVDTVADGNGVVCLHRLAIYELLAAIPPGQAHRFIATTLAPLLALPGAERARLLETLGALRETASVAETARRLGYERRTTHRHLTRIAELTGLDAREAGPRQRLALALGLWRLHRPRLPAPGTSAWTAPPGRP